MTAHAEPIGTPAEGAGSGGLDNEGNATREGWAWLHAAKVLGGVVAAATPLIVLGVQIVNDVDREPKIIRSTMGSIGDVIANEDLTEVTVAGTAEPGVDAVVVTIDPTDPEKRRFVGETDVFAQEWTLVIPTEPKLDPGYAIKANFYSAPKAGYVSSHRVLASSIEDPPVPPPVPPSEIVECVVVHGDSCFEGQPGWSDPSIYRSDQ